MRALTMEEFLPAVRLALAEDLAGQEDITTVAVVPAETVAVGRIVAKAPGVVAGLAVAKAVFAEVDPAVEITHAASEGSVLEVGAEVLCMRGRARSLLVAERTALNFLGRLCGIATRTRQCVELLAGKGTHILETRKTTPGLRDLEKYAVRVGGGTNHRVGLYDQVLLKENHFALAGAGTDPDGYRRTVAKAVAAAAGRGLVEAEARSLEEALAAIDGGADIVLLDNMSPGLMAAAVERGRVHAGERKRRVVFEASGGITMERLAEVAATGVERISIGALTHTVVPLDLSMLIEAEG